EHCGCRQCKRICSRSAGLFGHGKANQDRLQAVSNVKVRRYYCATDRHEKKNQLKQSELQRSSDSSDCTGNAELAHNACGLVSDRGQGDGAEPSHVGQDTQKPIVVSEIDNWPVPMGHQVRDREIAARIPESELGETQDLGQLQKVPEQDY